MRPDRDRVRADLVGEGRDRLCDVLAGLHADLVGHAGEVGVGQLIELVTAVVFEARQRLAAVLDDRLQLGAAPGGAGQPAASGVDRRGLRKEAGRRGGPPSAVRLGGVDDREQVGGGLRPAEAGATASTTVAAISLSSTAITMLISPTSRARRLRSLPPRSACREGRCVPAPERPADGGTSGRVRPCCRGRACGARLRRQVAAPDRTGTRPPEQDALDAVANGLVGLSAPRRQGRWPSPLARDRHRRHPRPRRGRHPRARSVRLMCGRSLASLLRGWARGPRNVTRGGCGPLVRSAAYSDRP